jgi:hypothetical protein
MTTLGELVQKSGVTLKEINAHCDNLGHTDLVHQVVTLTKKQQVALWDVAEDGPPLTLEYLVPETARPLESFPFWGQNSLPLHTRFQKIFYRDRDSVIGGYNRQTWSWWTGPGYFQVHMNPKCDKEIQIDYTMLPTEHPAGWPTIKSNMAFPTRFIYGGTKDNLRWVSKDVVIGRAFKMGERPMPNWFALCRELPSE